MAVSLESLDLPSRPGVYLFRNSDGRVLYVGKAGDLHNRVRSYFASNPDRVMIPELVSNSTHVDCIVTNNPSEALVLERQLIREHKPKYNSRLKDDKSYPFLALTNEDVPRILYTRHPPADARIWGPFPNAGAAKRVVQLLRRHFGIRDCKELLPQGCLSMHIGLCSAPCIDGTGYSQSVAAAAQVLDGSGRQLLETMVEEMESQSAAMDFELAAQTRDLIDSVQITLRQQVISSKYYRDCDALGFASRGDLAVITVLHADAGVVKAQESWPMIHRQDIGESVACFVAEHYANHTPPRLLLSPTPLGEWLEGWLCERRTRPVEVRVPARGDLATLRKLADQNAQVQLERMGNKQSGSLEQRAADDAAKLLGYESLEHIVCFDMAQLQGAERVGASVVFNNGRPAKKEYRSYRIKGDALDDLQMMREVVGRWLKRQESWPDLILLDGGKVHLDTIWKLLKENGVDDRCELAALAKREETLHRRGREPIILDRRGRVLVHARDEAHRYVNTFHRRRRGRVALADPLQEISGLGAKKLQDLMRHFGGRKGIEHAGLEQLTAVPGIGRALAQRILDSRRK
jgi:excinuclease ABC subunit C